MRCEMKNRLKNNIRYINTFFNKNKELKSYVMLIPGSGNILTDKLPKHADVYDYNYYEKIAEKEFTNNADNNTQIVNTYDALKKLSKDYIYYKTDHHWTTKGAFIAYNEFCKVEGMKVNFMKIWKKNVTDKFYGTLYSKVLDKKKKAIR